MNKQIVKEFLIKEDILDGVGRFTVRARASAGGAGSGLASGPVVVSGDGESLCVFVRLVCLFMGLYDCLFMGLFVCLLVFFCLLVCLCVACACVCVCACVVYRLSKGRGDVVFTCVCA